MTETPLLELRGVSAGYESIEVLRGVNLALHEREILALLGPNGAGKSTTLKVACGLIAPTAGKLVIGGHDVTGTPAEELARRGVCVVPEGKGIFPNLTVRENLVMATHAGVGLRQIEEIAYARFPRLGERRRQVAGTLSGGEQQMLAMARGLATEAVVLLLDELSMGLAPLIVEELYGLVATLPREGVSVLVVEQFARTVLGVADRAAIMLNGTVRSIGRPDELEDELSAAYLGA
jgi:branched-chain amino acid transport system ATP-binding protein